MTRRSLLVFLATVLLVGCVTVTPPSPIATAPPTATPSRLSTPAALTATPTPTQPAGTVASPTATSGTTGTPPTSAPSGSPSEEPAGTIDPQIAQQIDAVTAAMPQIRELSATRDVPYQFISHDQANQDLVALNEEGIPADWRMAEQRALQRLGLLPPDADIDALMAQLFSSEVAAYYRPDTERFYVIQRDAPFGPMDQIVVAHEYTHALQDMHFDLTASQITDNSQGDAQLAQLAVIEGDATLASQQWAFQNLSPDELLHLLGESFSALDQQELDNMPAILRRQLEFPYGEGFSFVTQIQQAGGWDAVNQAIQKPPASTEQILHEDKYIAGEMPVAIELPDLSSALGTGWTRTYEQTVGELSLQVFVAGGETPAVSLPGLPVVWPHQEAAAGWAGDRLGMYDGPNGAWAIEWKTSWDTPTDATEFHGRVAEVTGMLAGPASISESGQDVSLLIASDSATLSSLQSATAGSLL